MAKDRADQTHTWLVPCSLEIGVSGVDSHSLEGLYESMATCSRTREFGGGERARLAEKGNAGGRAWTARAHARAGSRRAGFGEL